MTRQARNYAPYGTPGRLRTLFVIIMSLAVLLLALGVYLIAAKQSGGILLIVVAVVGCAVTIPMRTAMKKRRQM